MNKAWQHEIFPEASKIICTWLLFVIVFEYLTKAAKHKNIVISVKSIGQWLFLRNK